MIKKVKELSLSPSHNIDCLPSKEKLEKPITLSDDSDESKGSAETVDILDNAYSADLIKNDEKFLKLMIETNDKAANNIQKGNCKESLKILEKIEKLLEHAASCGRILDRNLVIVILYNTACAYQAMWILDKCSKYIDGVIYNLNESIKADEINYMQGIQKKMSSNQLQVLKAIKLRKQHFLLKIYLQHCAVLSQLSKHDLALQLVKKSSKIMELIFIECQDYCKEMKKKIDNTSTTTQTSNSSMNTSKTLNDSKDITKVLNSINEGRKTPTPTNVIFKDEVPYLKILLEFAIPFLNEVIESLNVFSETKNAQLFIDAKKSLFNWKNNPENNEKYLRKEFRKGSSDIFNENRSLLGVQKNPEWLEGLNIGTIMHMKPLKYHEYAVKKELITEITKEALQEKIIFQSLCFFTTATEMRFLEIGDSKESSKKIIKEELLCNEGYKQSESFHLKAIELVCKYINGPCPFINHLISSYQKHYNQNLETIPEESFVSNAERSLIKNNNTKIDGMIKNEDHSEKQYLKTNILNELSDSKDYIQKIPNLQNEPECYRKPDANDIAKSLMITDTKSKFREEKRMSEGLIKSESKLSIGEINTTHTQSLNQLAGDIPSKSLKSLQVEVFKKLYDSGFASPSSMNGFTNKGLLLTQREKVPVSIPSGQIGKLDMPIKPEFLLNEQSNEKYFIKKNFNIPLINTIQQKIPEGLQNRSGNQAEKNSSSFTSGFRTERINHKVENDMGINSKEIDIEFNKDGRDPTGINFFFYKNFNKFIQNLYIQDEQMIKKKMTEGKFNRFSSYKKDPTPNKINKSGQSLKRPSTNKTQKSSSTEKIIKDPSKMELPRRILQNLGIPDLKRSPNLSGGSQQKAQVSMMKSCETLPGGIAGGNDNKEELMKGFLKESLRKGNLLSNNRIAKSSSSKNISNIVIESIYRSHLDSKEDVKFYSPRDLGSKNQKKIL